MIRKYSFLITGLLLGAFSGGCKPQTTAEKIENKVEDATHETKQGIERAGDKIKDATN